MTQNKTVLITGTLPKKCVDWLRKHGLEIIDWTCERPMPSEELRKHVSKVDGVICFLTDRVDEAFLTKASPALRAISLCAAGFDNVDVSACNQRGIPVSHTPGVLTEATADLTWALILGTARRIVEADSFVRQGSFVGWKPDLFLGRELTGATLGIVGFGRIGRAVAKRGRAFGMNVIGMSRSPFHEEGVTPVPFSDLLKRSDVISLHSPLTPETRHLFDAEALGRMKPGSILINTARGPVVDEAALVNVLRSGRLAGAGLDVFEREPKVQVELMELPNVVLLPHIGSATVETREKMGMLAVRQLVEMIRGQFVNVHLVPGSKIPE